MSEDSTGNAAIIEDLKQLKIGELRKRAATLFSVNVTKDMEAEDIIRAIRAKMNNENFAISAVGDMPKPGWARILLHKVPGESPRPLPAGVSGYTCTIPRNVKVDVPIKVYKALQTCISKNLEENLEEPLGSPKRWEFKDAEAYPMTLYAITEGPDPRPGHDLKKEAKIRPYLAFLKQFGHYPSPREIRAVIAEGRLAGYKNSDVESDVSKAA